MAKASVTATLVLLAQLTWAPATVLAQGCMSYGTFPNGFEAGDCAANSSLPDGASCNIKVKAGYTADGGTTAYSCAGGTLTSANATATGCAANFFQASGTIAGNNGTCTACAGTTIAAAAFGDSPTSCPSTAPTTTAPTSPATSQSPTTTPVCPENQYLGTFSNNCTACPPNSEAPAGMNPEAGISGCTCVVEFLDLEPTNTMILECTDQCSLPLAECHGACTDRCTIGGRLSEHAFIWTVFDWQNMVYCIFILVILIVTKQSFKATYAIVLGDTHGQLSAGAICAIAVKTFCGSKVENNPTTEADESKYDLDLLHHCTAISFSGFVFAVCLVGLSAISELAVPPPVPLPLANSTPGVLQAYDYVGFDTQFQANGATARFHSLLGAIGWMTGGLVLMLGSQAITRKAAMHQSKMDLMLAIVNKEDGNMPGAVAEALTCVAAGLVASTSVAGAPRMLLSEDIMSAGVFFVLAQIALLLHAEFYDRFYMQNKLWTIILKERNMAVAISYGLHMIACSLLVSNAVYKSYELLNFAAWFVIGGVLQSLMRKVLDTLLFSSTDLLAEVKDKHNWGVALIIGTIQIAVAQVINDIQPDTCQGFQYPDSTNGYWTTVTVLYTMSDFTMSWLKRWDIYVMLALLVLLMWAAKFFYQLPFKVGGQDFNLSISKLILSRKTSESGSAGGDLQMTLSGANAGGEEVLSAPAEEGSTPAPVKASNVNSSIAIDFAAYMGGVAIIYGGSFISMQTGFAGFTAADWQAFLIMRSGNCIAGLAMLSIVQVTGHHVIGRSYDTIKMLLADNRAVACLDACFTAAGALCIRSLITMDKVMMCIFFSLSLLSLVGFDQLFTAVTKYDDAKEVKAGNTATAISHGANLIAIAVIMARAVKLSDSIVFFGVWTTLGMLCLIATRFLLARILFSDDQHIASVLAPGWDALINIDEREQNVDDDDRLYVEETGLSVEGAGANSTYNFGAAILLGALKISVAQLLNTFARDCAFSVFVH